MREIKFRQPLINKEGHFIEWFYWGFINGDFITPALQSNGVDTRPKSQQYTGLKDKNGKEIYEGDITDVGVVVWHEEYLGFFLKGDFSEGDYKPLYDNVFVEVIGNIYENPELL